MPTQSIAKNYFPDYHIEKMEDGTWHNMYKDVDLSVGGYVHANPGMYLSQGDRKAAITLDVASMHPNDCIQLNYLGDCTQRYSDLLAARLAIKHKDFDAARQMFDGKLAKYLDDTSKAKDLSTALKTAANSAYGLTYASFPNKLRDSRNVNNIIALRGSLIMCSLREKVEEMGYTVIHIKTDSIKIANPDDAIINYILEYGKSYGLTFEVEHTWKKICLVNDAVFVGQHSEDDPDDPLGWETTGKEFQIPYIRKTLFTKEPIEFEDMCTTFNVSKGTLHLVFEAEDGSESDKPVGGGLDLDCSQERDIFVGRVGQFVPMKKFGAKLYRVSEEGKRFAAAGTTGYLWLDAESVRGTDLEQYIDMDYFRSIVDEAVAHINQFGDFEEFINN